VSHWKCFFWVKLAICIATYISNSFKDMYGFRSVGWGCLLVSTTSFVIFHCASVSWPVSGCNKSIYSSERRWQLDDSAHPKPWHMVRSLQMLNVAFMGTGALWHKTPWIPDCRRVCKTSRRWQTDNNFCHIIDLGLDWLEEKSQSP
jgi:hypothetical protein